MPLYKYSALTRSGKTVSGEVDADDPGKAKSLIREKGLFLSSPLEEDRKGHGSLAARLRFERPPGVREISSFTYRLKVLLASGLPLAEALTDLVNEERNPRLKSALADVRDRVKEGEGIAPAMSDHPDIFSDLYVNVISAGDAAGTLEGSLGHLSGHLERQERIGARVRAALIYPLFMAVIGFIILSYLLTSVVPKIVTVFHDIGKALPLPTVILINISWFFTEYWVLLFIAAGGLSFWLYRYSKTPDGRRYLENIIGAVPYIGATMQSMYLAGFGRTMEALLRGGVPLSKAVGIAGRATGHTGMAKALSDTERAILEGKTLTSSLRESPLFPASVVSLLKVGEAGGSLEDSFGVVGEAQEKELDSRLDTLLSLLNPVMIVFMGAIVGFIVLAILLPIFEMSQLKF